MIDTITIAQLVQDFPNPDELTDKGWKSRFDSYGNARAPIYKKKGEAPHISFFKSSVGTLYLTVTVSLPRFFYGSNAKLLNETNLGLALERLSIYVTEKSGIKFDALNATVWRVHFTKDYFVGEDLIVSLVARLSKMSIPRFEPGFLYNVTTCYFHSKKSRCICIYGKKRDAIAKRFSKEDIAACDGILRIELRYNNNRAVQTLYNTLNHTRPNRQNASNKRNL